MRVRIQRPPRRMTPAEWWADARDAAKCGDAGIPTAGDLPPAPTGRQSEIARAADHKIATVYRRTQAQTGPMDARLANLNEQIRQLHAKIGELSAQVAQILGRPVYRLPVEAGVPDEVVADRRAADNRKQAAPIRQQITALVRQRDELVAEAARIDHDIVIRWRQARSAARAVGELARRREARYWRLLCHRHPEGARLAALSDHPGIVLAAWVNGPADERSL
jgi:small-conductance mechanosensitive channel